MKNYRLLQVGVLLSAVFFLVSEAGAGALFHATRKAAMRRIVAKGFSPDKMRSAARFGKGVYLSNSPTTARMEARGAKTLIRVQTRPAFDRRVVNLRNPSPSGIRAFSPGARLRGAVKKGVIGPKLGRQLGRAASHKDKVIKYRSAKDPRRSNYVIPRAVYKAHPRMIKVTPP